MNAHPLVTTATSQARSAASAAAALETTLLQTRLLPRCPSLEQKAQRSRLEAEKAESAAALLVALQLVDQCTACIQSFGALGAGLAADLKRLTAEQGDVGAAIERHHQLLFTLGATLFVTLVVNGQQYRVGDCLYFPKDSLAMETEGSLPSRYIVRAEELWRSADGVAFVTGHLYVFPHETFHLASQLFYAKEVIHARGSQTFLLSSCLGTCHVLRPRTYRLGWLKKPCGVGFLIHFCVRLSARGQKSRRRLFDRATIRPSIQGLVAADSGSVCERFFFYF
jgi:hypothetical protein